VDEIKEAQETGNDLAEKHTALVNDLSELKTSNEQLRGEVADMEVELKKAGEARKAENMLYQNSVSDERATVAVLNMALGKLKSFYNFAQVDQPKTAEYQKLRWRWRDAASGQDHHGC